MHSNILLQSKIIPMQKLTKSLFVVAINSYQERETTLPVYFKQNLFKNNVNIIELFLGRHLLGR